MSDRCIGEHRCSANATEYTPIFMRFERISEETESDGTRSL